MQRSITIVIAALVLPATGARASLVVEPTVQEVLKQTEALVVARVTRVHRSKQGKCTTVTAIHLKPVRAVAGARPLPGPLVFRYAIHAYFGPKGGCPGLSYRVPLRASDMKRGREVIAALGLRPKAKDHHVLATFDLAREAELKGLFQGDPLSQLGAPRFRVDLQRKVFHALGCKGCAGCKTTLPRASDALAQGYSPHAECVRAGVRGVDVPLAPRQRRSKDRRCRSDRDCKLRPGPPCACSPCGTRWARAINLEGYRAVMKRWNRCKRRNCPRCRPTILGKGVRCLEGQCTVTLR